MPIPYDRLADAYFIRQDDGRVIFRPDGSRGLAGYWVTPRQEQEIHNALEWRLKRWRFFLIAWSVLGLVFFPFATSYAAGQWRRVVGISIVAVWAIGIVCALWLNRRQVRRLVRGLTPAPAVPVKANDARASGGSWLQRTAARQSYGALFAQVIVWSAILLYTAKANFHPTFSTVSSILLFGLLLLLSVACLYTKVRKRPAAVELSAEQIYSMSIGRSVRRIVWVAVAALFLLALVNLFIAAAHRNAQPSRETALPPHGRSPV